MIKKSWSVHKKSEAHTNFYAHSDGVFPWNPLICLFLCGNGSVVGVFHLIIDEKQFFSLIRFVAFSYWGIRFNIKSHVAHLDAINILIMNSLRTMIEWMHGQVNRWPNDGTNHHWQNWNIHFFSIYSVCNVLYVYVLLFYCYP